MAKGIQRKIDRALRRIKTEMSCNDGGKYARGLASEGFAGGYQQALYDVEALLRGVPPGDQRGYWTDEETHLDRMFKRKTT
jgi:hypothetical protein